MNVFTIEYYKAYSELEMKTKAAKEFKVFKKVKVIEDTPKDSDFLMVEAYRPETGELIELIIEKDMLLKKYQ